MCRLHSEPNGAQRCLSPACRVKASCATLARHVPVVADSHISDDRCSTDKCDGACARVLVAFRPVHLHKSARAPVPLRARGCVRERRLSARSASLRYQVFEKDVDTFCVRLILFLFALEQRENVPLGTTHGPTTRARARACAPPPSAQCAKTSLSILE